MMEIDEIHEKIKEDIKLQQRLDRRNKGVNLFNIIPEYKRYGIIVKLEVSLNLAETKAEISISTDLPFVGYYETHGLDSFVAEFTRWVKIPQYIPRNFNRKENKMSMWEMENLNLKKVSVNFEDIDIVVYPMAKKFLAEKGICYFPKVVKKLCSLQKETTKLQIKAVDRYIYLLEEIKSLKDRIGKEKNYYYSCDEDKTLKLYISKKEYNNQLKEIEKELKEITKKNPFLEFPESKIEYEEVIEKLSYKKFVKQNREDLEQEFEEGDFEEFCKESYQNWLEVNEGEF
ncbi:MAG: hypothetical protein P9L98_01630 [Candidatus Kaelpia imicola]|nr:hypothetical protein [Candidatus Kaelpia imicola]